MLLRCKNFSKEPKLVSFLSSLMTLATMDEGETSKVTVTDSIPASSKRGVNCINDSNSFLLAINFIMTSSDVLIWDFDDGYSIFRLADIAFLLMPDWGEPERAPH